MLLLNYESIEYACSLCSGKKQRFVSVVLRDDSTEVKNVMQKVSYIIMMRCRSGEYMFNTRESLIQFLNGSQIKVYLESEFRKFEGYKFSLIIVDDGFDINTLKRILKSERVNERTHLPYPIGLKDLRYILQQYEQNSRHEISDQEFFNILNITNPQ